jgi:hypothetical protein
MRYYVVAVTAAIRLDPLHRAPARSRPRAFGRQRRRQYETPGAAQKPWNLPGSNGSAGSIIDACSNQSEIFRPQKRKRVTMREPTSTRWWCDSN